MLSVPGMTKQRVPWWKVLLGFDLWRRALWSLVVLPASVAGLALCAVGQRHRTASVSRVVAGRVCGRPMLGETRTVLGYLVLSLLPGVLMWWLVLAAGPNTIRNVGFYWATWGGGDHSGAWGGPTLAGAWTVHTILSIVLYPVLVAVLRLLTLLQGRLAGRLLGDDRAWWPIAVAVLVTLAGIPFLISFVQQL